MKRLRSADRAWILLWIYVGTCDVVLPETLTEVMHSYLKTRWKWLVELWLLVFYLHLSRRLPAPLDPLRLVTRMLCRLLRGPRSRRR